MNKGIFATLLWFFVLGLSLALGQAYSGALGDPRYGLTGMHIQPAALAHNSNRLQIALFSFNATVENNYLGWETGAFLNGRWRNINDQTLGQILPENLDGAVKSAFIQYDFHLPSLILGLSRDGRHSVSLSPRWRNFFNLDGLQEPGARFAYERLAIPSQFGTRYDNDGLNANLLSYGELGLGYGIRWLDRGPHQLRLGAQVKLLAGMAGGYFFANRLSYTFRNNDFVDVHEADFSYGHGTAISQTGPNFNPLRDFSTLSLDHLGLGLDVGLQYQYQMDSSHQIRLGISLLDIGGISFAQDKATGNLQGSVNNYDLNSLQGDRIAYVDSVLGAEFSLDNTADQFRMGLPTVLSIQAEWQLLPKLWLQAVPYISLRRADRSQTVRQISGLSIIPRWEARSWGLGLPLSMRRNRHYLVGLTGRIGPLTLGSANVISGLFAKHQSMIDVHLALNIRLKHGVKKAPDPIAPEAEPTLPPMVASTPPPDSLAPAATETREPTQPEESLVPDVLPEPKPVATEPDPTASEAVSPAPPAASPMPETEASVAREDSLEKIRIREAAIAQAQAKARAKSEKIREQAKPAQPAPNPAPTPVPEPVSELASTPLSPNPVPSRPRPYDDEDQDGVQNKYDYCPTVPGPVDNNGCPLPGSLAPQGRYNQGIWRDVLPYADADQDGVPNLEDKCPDVPGPTASQGCPPSDPRIVPNWQKIGVPPPPPAVAVILFDTGLAHLRGKARLQLNEVATSLHSLSEKKLLILGHTDAIGQEPDNEGLSQRRAKAVRDYLVGQGVAPARLEISFYGENRPVDRNDSPDGRQQNRRVELVWADDESP